MPPIVSRQTPTNSKPATAPPPSTDDAWGSTSGIRILIYGQSGSGKTTLASTFPHPIRWLICSAGSKPVIIETSEQYRKEISSAGDYKTFVLDHASGLQDLLLAEDMKLDEIPAQRPIIGDNKQTWGRVALEMKRCLRALLNLPTNVVIIAQERTFNEELNSEVLKPNVGAALTPSLAGWLGPASDYVVQAYKRPRFSVKRAKIGNQEVETQTREKGVDYCIRTEPHDVYATKFRVPGKPKLPECIIDPDYDKILALIQGRFKQ
jgi:hypothetical protein